MNYPDVLQRQGRYAVPPGASDLPGLEVAGTIAAVGADVRGLKVGDAVCALTPGGGYAEYCRTPAEQCLPIPANVTMAEAATLPEVYFTIWFNLAEYSVVWVPLFIAVGCQSILPFGASGSVGERRPRRADAH